MLDFLVRAERREDCGYLQLCEFLEFRGRNRTWPRARAERPRRRRGGGSEFSRKSLMTRINLCFFLHRFLLHSTPRDAVRAVLAILFSHKPKNVA